MFEITEYIDARGSSPFARWFDRLDGQSAAKITTAVGPHGAGQPVQHQERRGRRPGVPESTPDPATGSTWVAMAMR